MHSQGMARPNSSTWDYQYNLTDHLGNVRYVTNMSKTFEQRTDYFPFGLAHSAGNLDKNKYLYNGKELQTELGYDVLDYGARAYDPRIIQWNRIDPLIEKKFNFSPYVYCLDNPLKYIDPNGMDEWEVTPDGKVRKVRETDDNFIYAVDEEGKPTGAMLNVTNTDILDQLSIENPLPEYDAEGHIKRWGDKRAAETDEDSGAEMTSLFLFLAENTEVEWEVIKANKEGNIKYGLTTLGVNDVVVSNFKGFDIITSIHSHPRPRNLAAELGGLDGDKSQSIKYKIQYNMYVYMPKSGNLYSVSKGKSRKEMTINSYGYNGNVLPKMK